MADQLCDKSKEEIQEIKNRHHNLRKEEIREIKNTIRRYEVELGTANRIDTFWEAFNSSRCKVAMLCISIIVTLAYAITILFQLPNEDLTVIVMGIIGFWSGRSSKSRDNFIDK